MHGVFPEASPAVALTDVAFCVPLDVKSPNRFDDDSKLSLLDRGGPFNPCKEGAIVRESDVVIEPRATVEFGNVKSGSIGEMPVAADAALDEGPPVVFMPASIAETEASSAKGAERSIVISPFIFPRNDSSAKAELSMIL